MDQELIIQEITNCLKEAYKHKDQYHISKALNAAKLIYRYGTKDIDSKVLQGLYKEGIDLVMRKYNVDGASIREYGLRYKDIVVNI